MILSKSSFGFTCNFLLVGCCLLSVLQIADSFVQELQEARDLWFNQTAGLPTNYTFLYNPEGDQNAPYVVHVQEDVVSKVELIYYFIGGPTKFNLEDFPNVDELFDMIELAGETALEINAEYDPTFGYPTFINMTFDETDIRVIRIQGLTPYTILENQRIENEELWKSYGVQSETYSFVSQTFCFCTFEYVQPKSIEVVDEIIQSVTDVDTGVQGDLNYDTIGGLFDRLELVINRSFAQITAEYHPTYGYPTRIFYNVAYGVADGSVTVEVQSLTLSDPPIQRADSIPGNVVADIPTRRFFLKFICKFAFAAVFKDCQ